MITPTIEHARKLRDLMREHGIVKGLGQPIPGKMCIEALVCHVLGLPHGDKPDCVGTEVNKFKIGLNDKPWSSPAARAKGMERLGIAQLGSNVINQKKFKDALWLAFGQKISPLIFSYHATKVKDNQALLKQADIMEKVTTLSEAKQKQREFIHTYGYDYGYGYGYGYGYDVWFTKVAKVAVQVLKDLKSPGCEWLWICDEVAA